MHVWPVPKDVRRYGSSLPQVGASTRPLSMQPGSLDDTTPQLQYECLWMRVSYISLTALAQARQPWPAFSAFSRSFLSFLAGSCTCNTSLV